MLVVIDAIGLYNKIPPHEGVQCVEEKLKQNPTPKVSPEFIASLLKIILEFAIFEFSQKKYIKSWGLVWEQNQHQKILTNMCGKNQLNK